ncbi:hypothetical protein H4R33_005627 [Dimargaris cristalligena]|uniref:Uncharacterized protein n=1 Tax=Dimargaris cristalligena TaxID=215637 RepID=A0A4P9ZRQ1_9FUNG|nr:hypothetical protein H4R33_005627 [Dimargaris cristalligena]RKP36226.1 hypothetical protein BJ085DRAFT_41495 [Dimargaris cristalligena]|eukprot:RKP36226.1 hypothetical protein BJ085DRAFT_41495 [Dimargaris cristalligena]
MQRPSGMSNRRLGKQPASESSNNFNPWSSYSPASPHFSDYNDLEDLSGQMIFGEPGPYPDVTNVEPHLGLSHLDFDNALNNRMAGFRFRHNRSAAVTRNPTLPYLLPMQNLETVYEDSDDGGGNGDGYYDGDEGYPPSMAAGQFLHRPASPVMASVPSTHRYGQLPGQELSRANDMSPFERSDNHYGNFFGIPSSFGNQMGWRAANNAASFSPPHYQPVQSNRHGADANWFPMARNSPSDMGGWGAASAHRSSSSPPPPPPFWDHMHMQRSDRSPGSGCG